MEFEESPSSSDEEWDDEDAEDPVQCLFCKDTLSSVELAISHCKSVHQFDFGGVMKRFNMECYSFIKLINFIRLTGLSPQEIMSSELPSWDSEEYLKPVLEYDPWLMFDFEDYFQSTDEKIIDEGDSESSEKQIRDLQCVLQEKNDEIVALTDQLEQMRSFMRKFLDEEADSETKTCNGSSSTRDGSYFDSYNHPGIHFDMLADEVRTTCYRTAITCNQPVFDKKIVLDLGCGTGILSMFAVSSGAEKVLAIDNSDIVTYTHDIIRENQMENRIDVIKARIEDAVLPIQQVDVIVSEWMGYFLLFEGMLDSLIYARDRYLKAGGVLLPDKCEMFVCGANDPDGLRNVSAFWSDVYGFKMSSIRKETMKQAVVDIIPAEKIVTSYARIASFNLYSCTTADTVFESQFVIVAYQDTTVTTLVGYFDVSFNLQHAVHFSTSPSSTPTHWKQTLFHIYEPIPLKGGEKLSGILKCERNSQNIRALKITVTILDRTYVYDLD